MAQVHYKPTCNLSLRSRVGTHAPCPPPRRKAMPWMSGVMTSSTAAAIDKPCTICGTSTLAPNRPPQPVPLVQAVLFSLCNPGVGRRTISFAFLPRTLWYKTLKAKQMGASRSDASLTTLSPFIRGNCEVASIVGRHPSCLALAGSINTGFKRARCNQGNLRFTSVT